jgi:hypothetical protein
MIFQRAFVFRESERSSLFLLNERIGDSLHSVEGADDDDGGAAADDESEFSGRKNLKVRLG